MFIQGRISGSEFVGGQIGIGELDNTTNRRKFYVDSEGQMFATTASISGDITSDSATLGKFTIDDESITASGSRMKFDAVNYQMLLSD